MIEQDGKYYAHVVMAPARQFPSSTDNQVEVVNGTDGNPQATKDVTPVDEILEPTATYTTPDGSSQGKLVVTAKSSDQFAGDNVVLSVDNPVDGSPVNLDGSGTATLNNQPVPPATVTVTSSKGGTLDVPVHLDVNGVPTRLEPDGVRGQGRPCRVRPDGEALRHRLAGQDRELPLGRTVRGLGDGRGQHRLDDPRRHDHGGER